MSHWQLKSIMKIYWKRKLVWELSRYLRYEKKLACEEMIVTRSF